MTDLQIACIVWNAVLGALILYTYYAVLFSRIGAYDRTNGDGEVKKRVDSARRWMWAAFDNMAAYSAWVALAAAATLSYVDLFVSVVCLGDWSTDKVWFAACNLCFLTCSAAYAPLLLLCFYQAESLRVEWMFWFKSLVIVDMLVVSVSAWGMFAAVLDGGGWLDMQAALILAIHCTFFDFVYWGYVWFNSTNNEGIMYHDSATKGEITHPAANAVHVAQGNESSSLFTGTRITDPRAVRVAQL